MHNALHGTGQLRALYRNSACLFIDTLTKESQHSAVHLAVLYPRSRYKKMLDRWSEVHDSRRENTAPCCSQLYPIVFIAFVAYAS